MFIASTNGDNTNLVIAQIAQRRFDVAARRRARARPGACAAGTREQGLHTICPTQHAIEMVEQAAFGAAASRRLRRCT